MRKTYENELLGLSKTDLRKEWENLWDKLIGLDPQKDFKEVEEINKRFDKCVESYYAVDCGDHWIVNSGSRVNGKYKTYKVKKELNRENNYGK